MRTTTTLKPLFIAPPSEVKIEKSFQSSLDEIENEERIDFYLNRLLEFYNLNNRPRKSLPNFRKSVRLT